MRPLLFASVISIALVGCYRDVPAGDDGPVGDAVARITSVPPMVGCVTITVVGSRSLTDRFNVTAGQPATLTLKNLPVGNDSFSAAAYAATCNAIAGTPTSWASTAPFVAPITQGGLTALALTLEPTGGAVIGINFDGDGGSGPGGDGGIVGGDGGSGPGGDGGIVGGDGGQPVDMAPGNGDAGPGGTDLAYGPVDLAHFGD